MLTATTRIAAVVIATLFLVGGLGLVSLGDGGATGTGLWLVVVGAGVLIALAIERNR